MKKRIALLVTLSMLLLLVGCETGGSGDQLALAQFVGGTSGISMEFVGFRSEVFDGGNDPFDLVIRLSNLGERTLSPGDLTIEIKGIQPEQFGKSAAQLTQTHGEELVAARLDASGNQLPGGFSVMEFTELKYGGTVPGQTFEAPIRAEACYSYGTTAVSSLCVVENLLNPSATATCQPSGVRNFANSGAPVHAQNFQQNVLGRDKIEFTFDIVHVGAGRIFAPDDTVCTTPTRPAVKVTVDTSTPGLQCTGFDKVNTAATKLQNLPIQSSGGSDVTVLAHKVRCTQTVSEGSEFEFPVQVELEYQYEDTITSSILVKKSLS